MKAQTILEFDDRIISFNHLNNDAKIENKNKNIKPLYCSYFNLKTGKLFFNLKAFNGYMFLDNLNNLYISIIKDKKIIFNDGAIFEGDLEKEPFILFDNYYVIEKKIIEEVDKINKEPDYKKKIEIENKILEEIIYELNNFEFKNLILKNGKNYLPDGRSLLINDNKGKLFSWTGSLLWEGDCIQETTGTVIIFMRCGKVHNLVDNYLGEYFYDLKIGRGKINDKEKFYFSKGNIPLECAEKTEKKIILLNIISKMKESL